VLREVPGRAEPCRRQRAVDARHERLAELLRLALRIVKEQ
jgi:hypothetical protein